jgi:hypothetical protein
MCGIVSCILQSFSSKLCDVLAFSVLFLAVKFNTVYEAKVQETCSATIYINKTGINSSYEYQCVEIKCILFFTTSYT